MLQVGSDLFAVHAGISLLLLQGCSQLPELANRDGNIPLGVLPWGHATPENFYSHLIAISNFNDYIVLCKEQRSWLPSLSQAATLFRVHGNLPFK